MRVFISSVRVGLEQERDALPGFIRALGHEPVRFEDFTAQPVPPRQACLDGVRDSDVYLLLLGDRYGHVFPESGLSPTAEEHVAARAAGVPRLVMRRRGGTPEPEQQRLIEEISSYRDGVFYNEFTDTAELQTKVAAALLQVAQAPGALTYASLPSGVRADWRWHWPSSHRGRTDHTVLELHVLPVPASTVPTRVLRTLPHRLATELRGVGGVGPSAAVPANHDATAAWAQVTEVHTGRRYDEARDGALLGCRVAVTGQTSVWGTLPGDSLGAILDPSDLTARLAGYLRTAGAVLPVDAPHVALAAGVAPLTTVTEGRVSGVPRTRASGFSLGRDHLTVPPDEAMSRAALSHGATDAARQLTEAVLAAYRTDQRSGF